MRNNDFFFLKLLNFVEFLEKFMGILMDNDKLFGVLWTSVENSMENCVNFIEIDEISRN